MVQLPTAIIDALVPETVHTAAVVEAKVTASPEVAVAFRVSVVPTVWFAIVGKLMVWLWPETVKLRLTAAAAAYTSLPACVALMVQVPWVRSDASPLATVHTLSVSEVNLTGSFEVAVAVSFTLVSASTGVLMAAKVMVWLAGWTEKLRVTPAAAV